MASTRMSHRHIVTLPARNGPASLEIYLYYMPNGFYGRGYYLSCQRIELTQRTGLLGSTVYKEMNPIDYPAGTRLLTHCKQFNRRMLDSHYVDPIEDIAEVVKTCATLGHFDPNDFFSWDEVTTSKTFSFEETTTNE